MVTISSSITIEEGTSIQRYEWKSKNKTSIYRKKSRRAVVRISGLNFVNNLSKKEKKDRQVKINFYKKDNEWVLRLNRTKEGATLQTYFGHHPYLQLVLNKSLPQEFWEEHKISNKKTYTRPITIEIDINEWKDVDLQPQHFIIEVEKEAKALLKESLNYGFHIGFIPKGRAYDLELIGPKGNKFILAISSHIAKNESRNKEKRKQKILVDISKMIPIIYNNKKIQPIIVSQPLEFEGSWSYTTSSYLDFYKNQFNFKFINTNFKKGWEREVLNKLLEIDKNVYPTKD